MEEEMKTKQEILEFLKSLEIPKSTYYTLGNLTFALESDQKRVTDFGLVTGFGDSFEYKGKGVVVLGHSDTGKTSLVRKFATHENCRVLAEDWLLLYDRNGTGELQILKLPSLEEQDLLWTETLDRYADFLANVEGPNLAVVLYLNAEDVYEKEGFVEVDKKKILQHYFGTLPDKITKEDIPNGLKRIPFLEYAKKCYGYKGDAHLDQTFQQVKRRLDEILESNDRVR